MKIIKADLFYFERVLNISYENYKNQCKYVRGIAGSVLHDISEDLMEMFKNQSVLLCINDNKLVGYIGYQRMWYSNEINSYSVPLCGYGAIGKDRIKILSMLFQKLAEDVCIENRTHFEVKLYAHDDEIIKLFSFLQFGIQCQEGIYDAVIPENRSGKINIRELTSEEKFIRWNCLWGLLDQLIKHLQKSPVFYPCLEFTEDMYKSYVFDDNTKVIASEMDGELIGMITTNTDGNSFINSRSGYSNVGDLYVKPQYRRMKIAESMLGYVIRGLKEKNIHTVWVEHGTANPYARGFWNKYFTFYAYTMVREINR